MSTTTGRRTALLGGLLLGMGQPATARPLRREVHGRPQQNTPHVEHPYAEVLLDIGQRRVLHALGSDTPVRPASLCKLMTMHLLWSAQESGRLAEDATIPFSPHAEAMPPTRLGLAAGEAMTAGDASCAMAVHSCNDVAVAVAEALAGGAGGEDAFARAMTAEAKAMGLGSTTFGNASGLPHPDNLSTARDLLLLGVQAVLRHPAHARVLGMSTWSWGGREYENTNRLQAGYPGMVAGKTGYIRESGFNLFALAQRDGRTLAAVVVGGHTGAARDNRMQELLDQGFAS